MSDEECFPRGRAPKPTVSASEKKRKLQIDRPESLFRESPKVVEEKKGKGKRWKNEIEEAGWSKVEQKEVEEEDSLKIKTVEFLQYKKLHDGMLILGCVKAIHELELVISLPNCQTGYVKINRVSTLYTELLHAQMQKSNTEEQSLCDMFHVGQLLVCSVCDFNPERKSIQLSIDPSVVNSNLMFSTIKPGMMLSGCIKSIEDHGYTIDVGKGGIKAFMARNVADKNTKVQPGSVIRCTVLTARGGGTILTLSNDPKKLSRMLAKTEHGITLDSLFPGTLVSFTPTKTINEGTIGNFLNFQGSVSILNAKLETGPKGNPQDGPEEAPESQPGDHQPKKKRRKNKDKEIATEDGAEPKRRSFQYDVTEKSVTASVLYVTAGKHVVLTTNPKVWRQDLRNETIATQLEKYPIGRKCKVKVVSVIKGMCVLCQVEKNGPHCVMYMRNLSDEPSSDDLSALLDNKVLKVRVIDNVMLDAVLEVSMKQSIMDAEFFRYEDITPGALVHTKVLAVQPKGLQVQLGSGQGKSFKASGNLRGFVSSIHLSDIMLKHPERQFNEGDVITCRVLTVDAVRRHLHLTHKSTLVKSKIPPITGYDQLSEGDVVPVFIVSVKTVGCVVKMYNNVTGLVPRHELSAEDVESPEKIFFVGQVMKCRVLSCEVEAERLLLSFCLKPKQHKENSATLRGRGFSVGQLVDVEVKKQVETGFSVQVVNADQSQRRTLNATLPTMHLSDFSTVAQAARVCLAEGTVLKDCVITSLKPPVTVSRKQMLVEFARQRQDDDAKLTFGDLQSDVILPGFVRHVAEYGAFVEVPNGLVGLCPKSAMCDQYLASTSGQLFAGQSVVAMVTSVEQEKRRFLVSLRPSECIFEQQSHPRIEMYCRQSNWISELKTDEGVNVGEIVEIKIEEDGNCTIKNVENDSKVVLLNKPDEHCDSAKAVVMHLDTSSNTVYLTNISSVVKRYKSDKKAEPIFASSIHCYVMHINDDVAIGYSKSDGRIVVVATRVHWNDSCEPEQRLFKVNQVVQANIKKCSDEGLLYGELKLKVGVGNKRVRQDSELSEASLGDFSQNIGNIRAGEEVSGTVKSIRATCALILIDSLPRTDGRPLVGRLHASEIEKDLGDDVMPLSRLRVGQAVKCHVIGCRSVRTHQFLEITNRSATRGVPELSMMRTRATAHLGDLSLSERFPPGTHVTAFVKHYDKKSNGIRVEVEPGVNAFLPRLLASHQPLAARKAEAKFRPGRAFHCAVVRNDGKHLILSRRGALIDATTKEDVQALANGCVTNGEVRKVVPDGLLVHTEPKSHGKIFITDLSDQFQEEPLENFKVGSVVRCAVVDCHNSEQLHFSARQSKIVDVTTDVVDPDVTATDLSPKQRIRGYIKSSSQAGIFVTLSRVCHGRVTFKRASKYYVAKQDKMAEYFPAGKLVHCSVVSVSPQDGRVELSMLEEDTGHPDPLPESFKLPLRGANKRSAVKNDPGETAAKKRKTEIKPKIESKVMVEEMIKNPVKENKKVKIKGPQTMQDTNDDVIDPGFVWEDDVKISRDSDDEGDSGIEDNKPVKTSKKQIEEAQEKEESEIKRKEEELMDGDRTPQSASEWERIMVSNPQNSMLWVRFMAFHLHATEIDKARAVGEKALKTISFREETEKLNIWVSLLNLENLYGSDAQLEETLGRAMQHNDQFKLLTHLSDIYVKSGKLEKADEVFAKMTRKYRRNKEVWSSYLRYLMEEGRHEDAQEAFKKSLQALEKKNHLEMISKFGRMEFSLGDTERGRTIFENALSNYPKRTDIWSLYVDALTKAKLIDEARRVFDRVISLPISSKRMRAFFKRYVEFETRHGSDSSVAQVRQKALDYINSETARVMED